MIGVGALGPVRPAGTAERAGSAERSGTAEASCGPPRVASGGVPKVGGPTSIGSPAELAAERQAWAVLATVDGLGTRTFAHLLVTHGSGRRVLELAAAGRLPRDLLGPADDGGGRRVRAMPARTADGVVEAAAHASARLALLADMRLWTLTLLDPDYPERLRRIPDPPPVLFGRGDPALVHHPATVAVVGTRRPTPAGRVLAASLARRLAVAGVAVISGLAFGIDGAAHAATAEAGRPTLAVIGSGHARPGPRAHRALVERILASGGAVVGELAPEAHATRGTYPRRNRLISALADAVVVVEAPGRSGALITARHALEQGVRLLVNAGGDHGPPWAGCWSLLEEPSAEGFRTADEAVAALLETLGRHASDAGSGSPGGALPDLGALERRVARELARGPATRDRLASATAMPPGVVSGLLTVLQLRGLATTLGPLNLPAGPLLSASPAEIAATRRPAAAERPG